MAKYNFPRLKREADIEQVLSYLGEKTYRKGANIFIHCPIPTHHDEHPTNCFFKKGDANLYCNTCAQSINAIDLIMYKTGQSAKEAGLTLWEIEGCPDWFIRNPKKSSGRKKTKKSFFLTKEECKYLHIRLPNYIDAPVGIDLTNHQKDLPQGMRYGSQFVDSSNDGYIIEQERQVTYTDFMTEAQLKQLVMTKGLERLAALDQVSLSFPSNLLTERGIIEQAMKKAMS